MWWADLGSPAGRRPVLLLSRDEAYTIRTFVTVAPVTTRVRDIPVKVPLGPEDGLPRPCVVNLDSLVTVARVRLVSRIARLGPDKLRAVANAIRFALDLANED